METLVKTPDQSINDFMAKLSNLPKDRHTPPPPSPPVEANPELKNQLPGPWQRKWLAMGVTHPCVQLLANAAEAFCFDWVIQSPGPRLLYIHGATGTGKSHVGRKIADFCRCSAHLALKNMATTRSTMPSTGSYRWPELANEFREKNLGALRDLFEADFLFLDDAGAEDDPFNVVLDKFYQVLSRREKKFTVITSNISAHEWSSRDPRIMDRLMRNSKIVDLADVPSYAAWLRINKRPAQVSA